tara:strand:+ start:4978 stop:5169 length:192 start_codon:yes stop_codon:yes gene_type:complete
MRQYSRSPAKKGAVSSLAKELGFCFYKQGSIFFLTKDCEEVFESRSLEEITAFLLGFKYNLFK